MKEVDLLIRYRQNKEKVGKIMTQCIKTGQFIPDPIFPDDDTEHYYVVFDKVVHTIGGAQITFQQPLSCDAMSN
jgi:hypothetical protein